MSCMMWSAGWLLKQCSGIGLHLELICGTPSYFPFLLSHQCPSRLVTVFLGTLWSPIKQIKCSYLFDGERVIALHPLQGNRASSPGEGKVSWFFSSCGGNLGFILEVRRGLSFKDRVCLMTSGLVSSYEGHRRNLLEAWQGNTNASRGEVGDRQSLSSCHSDTGFPINFQHESGIVTF